MEIVLLNKSFKNEKSIQTFRVFFLVGSLFVFNACQSDDEVVIIDDTPADGVNVADGLYLAAVGADPVAGAVLTSEVVEAEGFGSQARDGFVGGYVYLEAGDYNFVQVTDKAVVATWGGSADDITVKMLLIVVLIRILLFLLRIMVQHSI